MAATPVIAVGTTAQLDLPILYKYDSAGNSYPHGHQAAFANNNGPSAVAIALDSRGFTALCGSCLNYDPVSSLATFGTAAFTTVLTDHNGNVLWTANHGAIVTGIAIDADGSVYTAGEAINASGLVWAGGSRTGYVTTRKYSAAGVLQWSADHGVHININNSGLLLRLALGADGYLYTGGAYNDGTGNLTKYDPDDGSIIWQSAANGFTVINGIVADAAGNVYITGMLDTQTNVLAKYNSAGVFQSAAPLIIAGNNDRKYGNGVAFDADGNLVVVTLASIYNYETQYLYRYDPNCALLESQAPLNHTLARTFFGIAVDADNRVYLPSTNSYNGVVVPGTVWRFAADFSYEFRVGPEDDARCIAAREVERPALQIPIRLAPPKPIGDQYTPVPPLAMRLALQPMLPVRDYVGPDAPAVYRLQLTGDAGPVTLQISSLNIRRNASGSFVEVVVPAVDAATLAAIEARPSGDLMVYRGVVLPGGAEQSDVLLQVALSSLRYDGGLQSASVTLQGQGAPEADTIGHQRTRTLQGITYRNITQGRRRARSAVDTYLRVGDIADLGGGETLVVDELTIYIADRQATMEIVGT